MIFRNFDAYKSAKEYALEKAEPILARLKDSSNKQNLIISLKEIGEKFSSTHTKFQITATYNPDGFKPLQVTKSSESLQKAISSAIDTLKTRIQRKSEKKERSRKTFGKTLKPAKEFMRESINGEIWIQ